jgi:hypothetical protein
MDREFKQMLTDEIAELAKVKAMIAEHNRVCVIEDS